MKRGKIFRKRGLLELSIAMVIVGAVAVYFHCQAPPDEPKEAELSETGVALTKLFMESYIDGIRRPFDPDRFRESELKGRLLAIERMVKENPADSALLEERAAIQYQLGDYEASLADLGKILELEPHNSEIRQRRALVRYLQGSTHAAIADLDKIVADSPHCSPEVYNSRAYYRATLGEFEEALPDVLRSVKEHPTPDNLDTLGFVYMGLARFSEAEQAYTRGLTLDPDFPEMLYGRAAAYHQLGKASLSAADMARLQSISPDFCLHWSASPDPGKHVEGDKTSFPTSTVEKIGNS